MKKIIHVDMDCFYAAVEMRDNPAFRDVALAVGGNGPRSVLSTCNYLARSYGVRSAMPASQAKKLCPDLVIVEGRMAAYREVSQQIRQIFLRYTDIIEPLSLDEAYLDVSHATACHGSATLIAQQIRVAIQQELKLSASAGIAPNKFLAKIASDENKPNGQFVITPEQVADFVAELPLKKIPGIGPKTADKLAKQGFSSCADIRKSHESVLKPIVGNFAHTLIQRSFGIDDRELTVSRERKSLAIETTLAHDIYTMQECLAVVDQLMPKLELRLASVVNRRQIKQGIKLKFADFNQTTVEKVSVVPDRDLFVQLLQTAHSRGENRPIRLVGLSLGFDENNVAISQLALPID